MASPRPARLIAGLLAVALVAAASGPPAAAAPLEPSRFALSTPERGRLFLSPDKATPGFERLERNLLLHSPDGAFGPGRSVPAETSDGRRGWVDGRHVTSFDRGGLYLANLATGAVRRIEGLRGDADLAIPNGERAFALERASGRLFALDLAAATAALLFPGGPEAAEAGGHRILSASPDGRFVVWNAEPGAGRLPVTRIMDVSTRNCQIVRSFDAAPVSWGNGTTVLWGPDPWDGSVRLVTADLLVAEVAASRDGRARAARPKAGGFRHAELLPDGSRLLRLADDFTLRVVDAASGEPLYDAREVGFATFLPDGRLFARRPDGYTLYARDGRAIGGPWFATGTRDLPLLSRDGRYAMFISAAGRDTRFRRALDLGDGRVVHALAETGGEPILLNPRFTASGGQVIAEGGRLDLATGIFWREGRFDGFRPAHLSPHADLFLTLDRDGRHAFVDPVTGRALRTFPFPGGFAPHYGPDPGIVLLAPAPAAPGGGGGR